MSNNIPGMWKISTHISEVKSLQQCSLRTMYLTLLWCLKFVPTLAEVFWL